MSEALKPMNPLTDDERRLLSLLLEQLSDMQSNAGCNDWSSDMRAACSDDLRQRIADNDGASEPDEIDAYDFMATEYFINRLGGDV